jgi:hypothetical protein
MMHLGMGYNLRARVMDETLMTNKLDVFLFLMVKDEAKRNPSLIQKYFLSS